jgi:hypothetical protein
MSSDYNSIRQDNIREYGEGTRHLAFLKRLYSDRTHFVFEILQNAEDAGAKKMRFDLHPDRFEIRHDGRPFNEADVRGVCGVGEGTKSEDLTQIGKFGIGFKSVYAYTATPQIHSINGANGAEHFQIEHYVRPATIDEVAIEQPWTTLIVLPFNAQDINAQQAELQIAERLSNLGARTLLFLQQLEEIEFKTPNGASGKYLRDVKPESGNHREVTIIGQKRRRETDDPTDEEENWLVFHQEVQTPDEQGKVNVEIAFVREKDAKSEKWRIAKIQDSPLIVFFPTEKMTNLGFLIQGPYRTTPARDNIPKGDDWNRRLIDATAELLEDTLDRLKDEGMLTVLVLESLPIVPGDFPEGNMFRPIFDKTKETLCQKALLPTHDGTYAAASQAKLAGADELRLLLNPEQLAALCGSKEDLRWLSSDITERRTPQLWRYLKDTLAIADVDAERFAILLSQKFLQQQSDEWFARFYEFLLGREALWRAPRWSTDTGGVLRSKPILRLEDCSLVAPFDALGHPNAYLPPEHPVKYSVVRQSITEHKPALDFLIRLELDKPDEVADVIENILPKYRENGTGQIADEAYQADLKAIFRALKTDSQQKKQHLLDEAQKTSFVKSTNAATGKVAFKRPGEVYLPTEDMLAYLAGNQAAWSAEGLIHKEHQEAAIQLGLAADVRVSCRKAHNPGGDIELLDWHGWHERGLRGFDPKAEIDGLEFALSNPAPERSRFIWNHVLIPNMHLLKGFVEKATRQDYSNSQREESLSLAGKLVVENTWIIGRDGVFHMPSEITLADLPEDCVRDEDLARQLGMELSRTQVDHDDLKRVAEEVGVRPEYLEMAMNHPEEFAKWCEEMKCCSTARPPFPVKPVNDLERRPERISEQLGGAPEKEYEPRERSVRTTRGTVDPVVWLRNQYTNDADQMICQICKEEMPFRKRDGEHYFEAVEALSINHFTKEHEAQFLALCPLCAARYKEFVKQDKDTMETFRNAVMNSEEPEVFLPLGDLKTSVRFVESHFVDMKCILLEIQGNRF